MSDVNQLKIINPLDYPEWDKLVLSTRGYSFFHSSAWARVLNESYGYKPLYFTLIDDGRLLSLIPCMEIKSILTGKRAVSLPFTDFCEPIIEWESSDEIAPSLLNKLISYGRKAAWKSIEIRCGIPLSPQSPPFRSYYGHTMDISKKEDEMFSALRDSTRRNIRKAIKDGVKVELVNSLDSV